jgi:hypothetical protein
MPIGRAFRASLAAAAALAAGVAGGAAGAPDRYDAYYAAFDTGPAKIPGHDSSFVPQGLTYWPSRDALIISYYDSKGSASRVAIIDRGSGRRIKTLHLRTTGHVGGIGMTRSEHLFVANNGKLFRYPSATLARAADGQTVDSNGTYRVPASSFVGVRRNDLWVGEFATGGRPQAYPYRDDGLGGLTPAGPAIPVPEKTQGMAVTDRRFIFSISLGDDNDSTITSVARPALGDARTLTAPNMAEGMVLARGEIHVVYESASAKYAGADYRVRTIHHAPAAALGG